jgi:hypothetical protein
MSLDDLKQFHPRANVRLRRTKIEYAFVSVPIDDSVFVQQPGDVPRFSSEKVFEIAKRMGTDPDVLWAQENEPVIEVHPWQMPPPRA